MASAVSHNAFKCLVCLNPFKTPKIIPCGHTLCLCCIKQCISDKKIEFSCPVCLENVKIPKNGPENYPTVMTLQSVTSQSMEDVATTKPSQNSSQTQPPSQIKHPDHSCPNHEKIVIDHYCITCNLGICIKCVLMNHKYHQYLYVGDQKKNNKAPEGTGDELVRKKIENLERYQTELQESREKLRQMCDDSCREITRRTEEIIANIKAKCERTQSFIFNIKAMTNEEEWYFSEDKVIDSDVVWCCGVGRWTDGDMHINIVPPEEDNHYLESMDMKYKVTLLNSNIEKCVILEKDYKFTPDKCDEGPIIPWTIFVNENEGYLNHEGVFKIKYEVTQLKEIRKK